MVNNPIAQGMLKEIEDKYGVIGFEYMTDEQCIEYARECWGRWPYIARVCEMAVCYLEMASDLREYGSIEQ